MILELNNSELSIVASLSGREEFKVFVEWLERCEKDTHTRLYKSVSDREQHFLISEAATLSGIIGKCRQSRTRAELAATKKPPSDTW